MKRMVLAMLLVAGVADVSFAQSHTRQTCIAARESCEHIIERIRNQGKRYADFMRRTGEICIENRKNRFPNEEAQRQAFDDSCGDDCSYDDVLKKHPFTSEEKNFLRFCLSSRGAFDASKENRHIIDGLLEIHSDCLCSFGCREPGLFCY